MSNGMSGHPSWTCLDQLKTCCSSFQHYPTRLTGGPGIHRECPSSINVTTVTLKIELETISTLHCPTGPTTHPVLRGSSIHGVIWRFHRVRPPPVLTCLDPGHSDTVRESSATFVVCTTPRSRRESGDPVGRSHSTFVARTWCLGSPFSLEGPQKTGRPLESRVGWGCKDWVTQREVTGGVTVRTCRSIRVRQVWV